MRERIICRFKTEEDLNAFAKKNGWTLTNDMKEFNVNTLEFKVKKKVAKKKDKPKEAWVDHWKGLPVYHSEEQKVYAKIDFIFKSDQVEKAKEIFGQNVTDRTTSLWYPKLIAGTYSTKRVVGGSSETKYPIYVVSKGREDNCTTSKFLTQMEVKHYVVVEPQEYDSYVEKVENEYAKILILDMKYKDEYDTFDDLGDAKSKGPGGARNFCWEHSIKDGYDWHWVFDDNATEGFHWLYYNEKIKCRTGSFFRALEDFVDRYENIAIAGLNYSKFCIMSQKYPAYTMNTRIYSFLLIRNDIPYRWRGRYNEDTDLSLRVLKDGWCTVQFNAFTAGKATTQKVKGGNTKEFYEHEGTLPKSEMLEEMHPDVAKVVWKFNRWHHHVDYSGFKQELKLKEGIHIKDGIDNYGMKVIDTQETSVDDTKSYLYKKYEKLI